jgi:WD40 repeat protein
MKPTIALFLLLMFSGLCKIGDADPASQLSLFGAEDARIKPLPNPTLIPGMEKAGPVLAIAYSFDGKWLAFGGGGKHEVWVRDLSINAKTYRLVGHSKKINALAFRINGQLVSGSEDGTVRLWNVTEEREIRRFNGVGQITSVDVSPDGRLLVAGSSARTLKLWEIDTGGLLKTFSGHEDFVWAVAFSPDGGSIASGSEDRTVRVWNVSDGSLSKTFTGHTDRVWSVAFQPDGTKLASGSWDGTVRVWNVEGDGGNEPPFAAYDRQVLSVAFSPDGRLLAVGLVNSETDDTIKLWDVPSHQELRSFDTKSRHELAFSPNRFSLAAAGAADGAITIWNSNNSPPRLAPKSGGRVENQATLSWEAIEGAVYYDLEIARDSEFVQNRQRITTAANALDFPIENGVPQYFWHVRTGGFGIVGEWSETSSFLTPHQSPPVTCAVKILPPSRQVSVGEEFTVEIVIESVMDLAGFQFDLHWTDPQVLSFVTATKFKEIFASDQQLPNDDERFFQLDQENGFFRNIVATTFGEEGASGNGVLLAVLFRAETTGVSDIELQNLLLADSKTEGIPCQVFKSRITVEDPARPWDVNRDGVVNIFDLTLVAKHFGERITTNIGINPDINSDGVVDLFDIALVGAHFGETYR